MIATIQLPDGPEAHLTRTEAVMFLAAHGHPLTESSLATYATRGLGPEFVRFRGRPYYAKRALVDWLAKSVTGPLVEKRRRENESRRLVLRRAS